MTGASTPARLERLSRQQIDAFRILPTSLAFDDGGGK
jgi:hypothetical protein